MGASLNDDNGFLAEINVTPFVDVMLVLLIIFMVTAPMLTQGVEVELPQTKAVKSLPQEKDHLVLTVGKEGELLLDEYEVELEGLQDKLASLVTEQDKELYLRADKEVPYGIVVRVMGEVKAAGIETLGILAEPVPASKEKKGS